MRGDNTQDFKEPLPNMTTHVSRRNASPYDETVLGVASMHEHGDEAQSIPVNDTSPFITMNPKAIPLFARHFPGLGNSPAIGSLDRSRQEQVAS